MLSRLSLSRRGLMTAAATSAAFAGLARYAQAADITHAEIEADPYRNEIAGYGPLKPDPAGLFDLPEGFSYTVISRAGETMSDGLITPYKADGMGCFALGGDKVALVRNHELKLDDHDIGAFGKGQALLDKVDRSRIYDLGRGDGVFTGGTVNLVYDLRTRKLESQHLSLVGASTNCAGGITPWGSWLSCEEIVLSAGDRAAKSHGWVFDVPSTAKGLVEPAPIAGLGRFRHEAVCIDPRTGVVYLTEDEGDGHGLFYRFLPNDRNDLHKGGRLQALAFKDAPTDGDSRNWQDSPRWSVGQWRETLWIDLDGTDNPNADLRHRGHAKGAAWFARGEGIFFAADELYFCCTSGGPNFLGQIMRYQPSGFEGQAGEIDQPGRLQLFVQPDDRQVLQMCDNLCVSPWGHLVVCEDKAADRGINYLKAVSPQGKVYTLGRQAQSGLSDVGANSELAGCCFSPDGTTLFVNVYWPGMTIAITGPWSRFTA
jgi:secreted PhoX family phosphatase